MTRFFLLLFLSTSSILLSAQDQIILMNGEEISGWVFEVGPEIRYRAANFPDGPIYVLVRDEVAMILYENGHEEFLSADEHWRSEHVDHSAHYKYLRMNGHNRFYEGFTIISRADFEERLHRVPGAYEDYTAGRSLQVGGYVVSGAGLVLTFAGIISNGPRRTDIRSPSFNTRSSPSSFGSGAAVAGIGVGVLLGGAILYGVGNRRMEQALDNYNIAIGKEVGLQPSVSNDGFGIVLKF